MRKIILILIFLLAFTLRFYQLGYNPPSLDWDEASLGYNAYSILKTGRDEYGNFLPLSIRSFNDYKPPLYTYLTTISVYLFGLNEFSTRFISALFGTIAVITVYFLVKELFPQQSFVFYLLSFIFFSISPWHIQFSRIAFEANISLTFFIVGVLFFLKGVKKGPYFIISLLSFVSSIYAYHSPRLIVPLFILGAVIIFRKNIGKQMAWFLASVFVSIIILIFPFLRGEGLAAGARFGSVTVINPSERLGPSIEKIEFDQRRNDVLGRLTHNRRIVYARDILGGYLDHFNFDFLFLSGDPPGRHHAAGMGMLYIWDLPFVALGILGLLGKLGRSRDNVMVVFWWFLVAPAASALTTGTPHAVRAIFYLPIYQVFAAFGFIQFWKWSRKLKEELLSNAFLLITILFFIFNIYYYFHMYYIHTPSEYAKEWQYGYKQVVEQVEKHKERYNNVIVTYHYDQPYVYFLFYQPIDPSWYQKNWGSGEIMRAERKFGKYEFRNIDWQKDSQRKNVLLVASPGEIPEDVAGLIAEVYFPNGEVAFRIVGR